MDTKIYSVKFRNEDADASDALDLMLGSAWDPHFTHSEMGLFALLCAAALRGTFDPIPCAMKDLRGLRSAGFVQIHERDELGVTINFVGTEKPWGGRVK